MAHHERSLYPAEQLANPAPQAAQQSGDTSRDEQLARELQAQFDRGVAPVLATPAFQVPYSCGACGTTHAVRNVAHGATFACTVCGTENRILLQHHRPSVVVMRDSVYPVPIPVFCSIL